MRLLIVSHTKHKKVENKLMAYAPYIIEMNLWLKNVDAVEVVAPLVKIPKTKIDLVYEHDNIMFNEIPTIAFTSLKNAFFSLLKLPLILFKIILACKRADHIHLRCPGNIGLLGCLVQILFPKKTKSAKYAGNWDPNAKQPLSYRFQKRLLSNVFLTRNMSVMVYGDWPNQTKNICSFFTATYKKEEIESVAPRVYSDKLDFLFVGSLVKGKRPLLAIKIIEQLYKLGYEVNLNLYGDGVLKEELLVYITTNKLEHVITLHGNQNKQTVKTALKKSHFLILPSKSEGWPKVLAEAMFFGVIPVATKISCVPYMLDYGDRGILIEPNLEFALKALLDGINKENLQEKSYKALIWSQQYTLETFEKEIAKLLKNKNSN